MSQQTLNAPQALNGLPVGVQMREYEIRSVLGGFAAKEQYEEGIIGAWTDVYSLSAVCYYVVTGTIPDGAISRIARDSMKPLASFATQELPASVLSVIDQGFAPDARDRYGRVKAFARDLESAVKHFVRDSDKPLVRDMIRVDEALSEFSTKQKGLLQTIWGWRHLFGTEPS